jgi:hypothetical protein
MEQREQLPINGLVGVKIGCKAWLYRIPLRRRRILKMRTVTHPQ